MYVATSNTRARTQYQHTCVVRYRPSKINFKGSRPRHSSRHARPRCDTRMCHRIAHLGHMGQGWWRANTMVPLQFILSHFHSSRHDSGVIRCCALSIQCSIDTKLGEHSYFIWTDLTLELHAQIPSETPTFEVKARGPTQPFNKPIFALRVYSDVSYVSTCLRCPLF